jgi:hypothetical protein
VFDVPVLMSRQVDLQSVAATTLLPPLCTLALRALVVRPLGRALRARRRRAAHAAPAHPDQQHVVGHLKGLGRRRLGLLRAEPRRQKCVPLLPTWLGGVKFNN